MLATGVGDREEPACTHARGYALLWPRNNSLCDKPSARSARRNSPASVASGNKKIVGSVYVAQQRPIVHRVWTGAIATAHHRCATKGRDEAGAVGDESCRPLVRRRLGPQESGPQCASLPGPQTLQPEQTTWPTVARSPVAPACNENHTILSLRVLNEL